MEKVNPYHPPQAPLSTPVVSETWPKALVGYFLFVVARWAILLAAASEPPEIQRIAWTILMIPVVAASAVVLNGILWFYMALLALGAVTSMSSSIRIVGNAFFRPAVALSVLFFVILVFRSGTPWQDPGQLARGGYTITLWWALVNVVRTAKRTNSFGASQVVLFVLWGCGIAAVAGALYRSFS